MHVTGLGCGSLKVALPKPSRSVYSCFISMYTCTAIAINTFIITVIIAIYYYYSYYDYYYYHFYWYYHF
jgi:hypothetical protein